MQDLKYIQDGPPAGGFPAIRYARRIGAPGPTGVAIFGVGAAICAYGFYRVGQANHKRNEYLREKVAARKVLLPVLQAEEVCDAVRRGDTCVNVPSLLPSPHVFFGAYVFPA